MGKKLDIYILKLEIFGDTNQIFFQVPLALLNEERKRERESKKVKICDQSRFLTEIEQK